MDLQCQASVPGTLDVSMIPAGPTTNAVGDYIMNLRNVCTQKIGNAERVGGIIDFDGDRIKLYSMPG